MNYIANGAPRKYDESVRAKIIIFCFWTFWGLFQGSFIYAIDGDWRTAVPWTLFFAGIGAAWEQLLGGLFAVSNWLNRVLRLQRSRMTFSLTILTGALGGPLIGPLFGILLRQLLGLRVSGLRSAQIGLCVGIIGCSVCAAIGTIVLSRQRR